jgi:hypothetical protein
MKKPPSERQGYPTPFGEWGIGNGEWGIGNGNREWGIGNGNSPSQPLEVAQVLKRKNK